MTFGVCCTPEHAPLVLAAGFDYVELPALATFGNPEFDLSPFAEWSTPVTNMFFPGTIRTAKPHQTEYRSFVEQMFQRASGYGVSVMVVGSGGPRRAPDGYDPALAEQDFIDVVADCQVIADRYGITLAPESLNHLETNVGNDLGRLAQGLSAKGVAYTVDSYHVLVEGGQHDLEAQIPFCPAHVHLGNLERTPPLPDDPDMVAIFRRLRAVGYSGRFSLEARHEWTSAALGDALAGMRALAHGE